MDEVAAAKLRAHAKQVVDTWPPLSDQQRTRLAELLAPARQAIRDHRLGLTD